MPEAAEPAQLMPNRELREYSLKLAGLAVDVLVDANIVAKANFHDAELATAVELYVRFSMGDLPPE